MSRDDFTGYAAQEAQRLALDENSWSRGNWTQTWLALYLIQRAEETLVQFRNFWPGWGACSARYRDMDGA